MIWAYVILWCSIGLIAWFTTLLWFKYAEPTFWDVWNGNDFLQGCVVSVVMGFLAIVLFIYLYKKETMPEKEKIRARIPWYLLKEHGGKI